jgi:hypothetical protein
MYYPVSRYPAASMTHLKLDRNLTASVCLSLSPLFPWESRIFLKARFCLYMFLRVSPCPGAQISTN